MTKIARCKVENIKGARDVEFSPNGQSVTIGGANGQGKSSALDALVMALGGRNHIPADPVRHGSENGTTVVELDEFNVRFEVSADRKSFVRVESKAGVRHTSPQAVLDKVFGNLSFDPGKFKSLERQSRFKMLTELLKIDPTALETEAVKVYEERTVIGRSVGELAGKMAGRELVRGVPDEELSPAAVMEKQRDVLSIEHAHKARVTACVDANRQAADVEKRIVSVKDQIDSLQDTLSDLEAQRQNWTIEFHKLKTEVDAYVAPDRESLTRQIQDMDVINRNVRANKELLALRNQHAAEDAAYKIRTARLEAIEEEKKKLLSSVPMPIDGLEISGGAVFYNGIPFEQLSESEQWEVSTAIACALNPGKIVFIRHSGGMDIKTRERVRARAASCGVQLFMEVVDDADDVQILIEDGAVKEDRIVPVNAGVANGAEVNHASA